MELGGMFAWEETRLVVDIWLVLEIGYLLMLNLVKDIIDLCVIVWLYAKFGTQSDLR